MATRLIISGWSALLALAALLAAAARANSEYVTTAECKARGVQLRLRRFPTDSDATYLAIWGCGLTEIDEGYQHIFTGLPNLKMIDLQENHIENINPTAFHTVPTLTKLWLQHNKLRTLPVFDERSCPNLTQLLLYSNKLTGIENERTFSACVKLEYLDLGLNYVEFIHPDAFRPLIELKVLFLNSNKISFIQDQIFANNSKLERLYLNYNRITHLPPDFTSNLKQTSAGLRLFYFEGNPWHCACLLELLADIQKAGVSDYKKGPFDFCTHYDGTRPACTYVSMYPCHRHAPRSLSRVLGH